MNTDLGGSNSFLRDLQCLFVMSCSVREQTFGVSVYNPLYRTGKADRSDGTTARNYTLPLGRHPGPERGSSYIET